MTHTCVLSVCVCVSDNDGEENYTDYMEKRAFFLLLKYLTSHSRHVFTVLILIFLAFFCAEAGQSYEQVTVYVCVQVIQTC